MRLQDFGMQMCCAALVWGCGEDISLGECAGEGVTCEVREAVLIEPEPTFVVLAEGPEREATVLWREISGPDLCREQDCSGGEADMVVHGDSSVTIAQSLSAREPDSSPPSSPAGYV